MSSSMSNEADLAMAHFLFSFKQKKKSQTQPVKFLWNYRNINRDLQAPVVTARSRLRWDFKDTSGDWSRHHNGTKNKYKAATYTHTHTHTVSSHTLSSHTLSSHTLSSHTLSSHSLSSHSRLHTHSRLTLSCLTLTLSTTTPHTLLVWSFRWLPCDIVVVLLVACAVNQKMLAHTTVHETHTWIHTLRIELTCMHSQAHNEFTHKQHELTLLWALFLTNE